MYLVETYVHAPPLAWQVTRKTVDKYREDVVQQVAEIAQGLSYRDASSIPRDPGACVADGLLSRAPERNEEFHGGAEIKALSWSISFTSETSGPRDNVDHKDLFKRVDEAIDMAGTGSGIQKLRRAKVQVDGRTGQEYVGLYPEKHAVILDAKLDLYGNATPQVPTIKLVMEAGWPIQKNPADPRRFLNQDEALAIWDAVVKSVRPRPGAF
jgi:hypothetical protein